MINEGFFIVFKFAFMKPSTKLLFEQPYANPEARDEVKRGSLLRVSRNSLREGGVVSPLVKVRILISWSSFKVRCWTRCIASKITAYSLGLTTVYNYDGV